MQSEREKSLQLCFSDDASILVKTSYKDETEHKYSLFMLSFLTKGCCVRKIQRLQTKAPFPTRLLDHVKKGLWVLHRAIETAV